MSSFTTECTTLDMTALLEHVRETQHVRSRGYTSRHRNTEPHPLLIALVVLVGLSIVVAFWGLISFLIISTIL